uniref:Uncharacterized protein n=1 Tax=Anguilla anguilla TaxID=7936 RepID=A0A0E9QWW8_ANGAN
MYILTHQCICNCMNLEMLFFSLFPTEPHAFRVGGAKPIHAY